jgi:hypothetical protein
MLTPRLALSRRVSAALDAAPSRIPVLLGGCGSGRSTVLQQLRDRIGRTSAQFIDVERIATTPERFLRAATAASPFPVTTSAGPGAADGGARGAFDRTIEFFTKARTAAGEPALFLLDEFLELRTFESFPGLRRVLREFADAIAASSNRFVLTSRYTARSLRLLRDLSARFEVVHVPGMTLEDVADVLAPLQAPRGMARDGGTVRNSDSEYLARTVLALTDGRPAYVRSMASELAELAGQGPGGGDAHASSGAPLHDPISALSALLAPAGRLADRCGYCYELRLHRARGYGALKAILEILAEEEGLTLTEISHRMERTPGSTKDYLSWLEDVDLVVSTQKRYSFVDPLLRVWVRLHCRATAPTDDDLAREVHRYALPRLPASEPKAEPPQSAPQAEPAYAMAGAPQSGGGIIEID